MLTTIISGGQTGADRAGLDAAIQLGIETGGTMPKGFKALDGDHPEYAERYHIVESDSGHYQPRTEANVVNSDGTARFAINWNSRGERLTKSLIDKHNKPCFDVDLRDPPDEKNFRAWLFTHKIEVLNVAGNAESISKYGSIYELTLNYLLRTLVNCK